MNAIATRFGRVVAGGIRWVRTPLPIRKAGAVVPFPLVAGNPIAHTPSMADTNVGVAIGECGRRKISAMLARVFPVAGAPGATAADGGAAPPSVVPRS